MPSRKMIDMGYTLMLGEPGEAEEVLFISGATTAAAMFLARSERTKRQAVLITTLADFGRYFPASEDERQLSFPFYEKQAGNQP